MIVASLSLLGGQELFGYSNVAGDVINSYVINATNTYFWNKDPVFAT